MLEIKELLSSHQLKAQELKSVIHRLYQIKQYPDFDKNTYRLLYILYLEKKLEFEELDIQYKTYLKINGLSIQ